MQITFSLNFFSVVLSRWKRTKFKISISFDFKKNLKFFRISNVSFIWWAILLTNSLYEQHGNYVSGFTFLLHQEGPKKSQSTFSLLSRGWNYLPGACSDLDISATMCLEAHTSAHTSFGSQTDADTRLGAYSSTHMSLWAHISKQTSFFLLWLLYGNNCRAGQLSLYNWKTSEK